MREELTIFDEPLMEVEGGRFSSDPHDGLALFGLSWTSCG